VCIQRRERRYKLGRSLVVMRLGKRREREGTQSVMTLHVIHTSIFVSFFLYSVGSFCCCCCCSLSTPRTREKFKKKKKFPIAAAASKERKVPCCDSLDDLSPLTFFFCPKRTELGAKRGVDWKTVTRANQHTRGHEKEEER